MAVDIGCIQLCWRVVIHNDDITGCALFQNTKGCLKVTVCNGCIVLKQHLRNFSPCRIGVAKMMFVQYIGHLIRFEHIMCITVCTKTCQDTSVNQLHGWRASAGIAHVGFRIMYHHCVGIFDQIHFMRVNVNTMTQQRLLTENVEIHQSVHDTFAIFLQTVMQIFDAFCHMDMIADFIRFVRSCQLHSCIGNCKLCMHTHHTGDHI